jgi:hypothetical protein
VTCCPSRRSVLRAGLALPLPLLAGCTDPGPPAPPPPPDPDIALHDAAVAREQELLAAYDAGLLAAPGLAPRLAPLRAQHAEHLAVLETADPAPPPSAAPSASASPTAAPSVPAPPAAPADPAIVLAELVVLENDAGAAHADAAVEASRELAPVLATLAASEASHRVALS